MAKDSEGREPGSQGGIRGALKRWLGVTALLFFCGLGSAALSGEAPLTRHVPYSLWRHRRGYFVLICICTALSLLLRSDRVLLRFLHWIFGGIGHVRICSPELERRIRERYRTEIGQLTELGFDYLFSHGETFSLFRLLLIFPAMVVFAMWRRREVLTVYGGTKILAGYAIYLSRDKTTYAHAFGYGVKFHTLFQDGTLLLSANYADDTAEGPLIVKHCRAASIGDTWAEHQRRIQELEASGKLADRHPSFQAFAEISHKETAAW
jgi:hypothetical protein